MNLESLSTLRTRRGFLRQAACAALGTVSLTNTIRDLRIINAAIGHTGHAHLTDYKALVCIFLSGGNDANNLLVPIGDEDYSNYSAVRQNLALPRTGHPEGRNLLPINQLDGDGRRYGLHPNCPELQSLFEEGKAALLLNVGTLVQPMTRAQYQSGSVARPPQLFSHSDQVTQWQTSIPDQPPRTGWGGRCADLLHTLQEGAQISLCTSLAGTNTFEVGNIFQQYHVSTNGAVTMSGVTGNRLQAVKSILAVPDTNLQRTAYADVVERAIATGDLLNSAISPTAASTFWTTPFPASSLGNQLRMVARLIHARDALTMKRQIFFCSVGGYDTHTAQTGVNPGTQVADPTYGSHANLLNELSEAIFAFQRAMVQVGTADKVTAFTASDFGRTFPTNGQGSDHGWGSHQIIVGGAVRGKRLYGSFPALQVNGPDDTSTGRWIPKIAVDQYSATLARWFGVSPTDMPTVFPNLGRFAAPDLGFMA